MCKGRPKALTTDERELVLDLYFQEGMPVRRIADVMEVSHMTVWRAVCIRESKAEGGGDN